MLNKSLQPPGSGYRAAARFTTSGPAWLNSGRQAARPLLRIRSICSAVALALLCFGCVTSRFPAASIKWDDHFGTSDQSTNVLCLMARGFFLAPTTNIQAVTDSWLKTHPKAQVVLVSTFEAPPPTIAFVWIVDGDHSLNVELVRQGCLPPQTQQLGKDQKLAIAQKDYDIFLEKIREAGRSARESRVGIWKNERE